MVNKNPMSRVKRESLGVLGVDELIEGGVPRNSVIGLNGPPGVGKSIFSLHFLLEGARKGQKVVYINLEEPRSNINNMINTFSFSKEFYELEKCGLILIRCFDYIKYEKVHEEVMNLIHDDKSIKRLVIDSFNCFFNTMDGSENCASMRIRRVIVESIYKLRRFGLTTLLVLEKGSSDYNIPYLVDGIIKLEYLEFGSIERRISIPKMRWTNQYRDSKSYEISEAGIVVDV